MIVHIVIFKMKAEAEGASAAENAQRVCDALRSLVGKVPQIVDLSCGVDFNRSDAAWDVGLYTTFRNQEDLQGYLVHPAHQEVAAFIGKVRAERAVVDYDL